MSILSEYLDKLWRDGFFKKEKTYEEIKKALGKLSCNPEDPTLGMALLRSKFLTRRGTKGSFKYIEKFGHENKLVNTDLFSENLIKKLKKDFAIELSDLKLNYGRSGTCTAFLLRKILEKFINLAFLKQGLSSKLKDANNNFLGLKAMINLCTSEKIGGSPFLIQKTADELQGIKFLGDTAAHNPLTNVNMRTITPQMPFIITAFEELAKKL